MAIRLIDRYPSRANPATTQYPHGSGRNKSDPTADDGTPFDEDRFNDQEAFFQGLLERAGITPSGTVDTVTASDYIDALRGSLIADNLTDLQAFPTQYADDGFIMQTAGRTSAGDGGEGYFRWDSSDLSTEVGNDEVTAGEGDGGIYVAPDSDKTGASGAWVRQFNKGLVFAEWYGQKADASTDDAPAIQKAVDALSGSFGGGVVQLRQGKSNLGSTIDCPDESIDIRGRGITTTTLEASHSSGPVIRFRNSNWAIQGLTISANSDRQNGSAGSNYGVHVEADDTAGGTSAEGYVNRVKIIKQPSHGFLAVGTIQGTFITTLLTLDNGGHGIAVDRGVLTNRTNKKSPGIVSFMTCESYNNGGHAVAIGHPDDGTSLAYRIQLMNIETESSATDPSFRYTAHTNWIRGENHSLHNCVLGGGGETTDGLYIEGRLIYIENTRVNGVSAAAITVGVPNDAGFSTNDIRIEGIRVFDVSSPLDPAIVVEDGATGVLARTVGIANITSLITPDVPRSETHFGGREHTYTEGSIEAKSFKSSEAVSIANEEAKTVSFTGNARGILVLSGNSQSKASAIVFFRVGDFEHATLIGSTTGNVATTTGALSGTTGVAGELTISAHTDNNLYIENRLGSSGDYVVTLLSLDNARFTGFG